MVGHASMLLRDLNHALQHNQPLLWARARQEGADLRHHGGHEVLDRLLDLLGLYTPLSSSEAAGHRAAAANDWHTAALNEVLTQGVQPHARVLLRVYRAGRTDLLARLLAQEPLDLNRMDRALLLCQAALLRERGITPDGPRLGPLPEPRREQLFNGLVRWGLPLRVVLDPVTVANNRAVFHLGRVSLRALDGPGGLSAWFSHPISVDTVDRDERVRVIELADHWFGPSNVMEALPTSTVLANRRRFAVAVENRRLHATLEDLPPAIEASPRARL